MSNSFFTRICVSGTTPARNMDVRKKTTMVDQPKTLFVSIWLGFILCCTAKAEIPCTSDSFCGEVLLSGSECLDNVCSNPFYKAGCLRSYLPGWHKTRVCNSDDPPEAMELGYCVPSPFDYVEVRALAQDWESSFVSTWIVQIILSEILDVPVSLETGVPGLSVDFYDRTSRMDYGQFDPNNPAELQVAAIEQDCRNIGIVDGEADPNIYTSCAHIVVEGWWEDQHTTSGTDYIEKPNDLGVLSENHWWIPRFTAERDPSLGSYLGLAGEKNRQKLADTFKWPTSWKLYCDAISSNGCATADGVATRAPVNEDEANSFYTEGLYIGHFRDTSSNDCASFPGNCTGHFADYPCTWQTYSKQQIYHLGVSLELGGPEANGAYTYSQLTQIWRAANATKSDVIMMWWNTEIMYEEFVGTEAEFTRVVLPPPTALCDAARADLTFLCGDDEEAKVGDPAGTCDLPVQSTKKLVSTALKAISQNEDVSEALWSPAYEFMGAFGVTNLQYGDIFQRWFALQIEEAGFDPRDAVCSWVVDNIDLVQTFIPATYPRIIQDVTADTAPLVVASFIVSSMAVLVVLGTIGTATYKKNTKVVQLLQPQFIGLVLLGLLCLSLSALVLSLDASDVTCVVIPWLEQIGALFVLEPTLMRMREVGRLATLGKQMQRVRLRLRRLAKNMATGLCVAVAFLVLWTVFDSPGEIIHHEISNVLSATNDTIVFSSNWCASSSNLWYFVSVAWQAMMLLPSLVLVMITNRAHDINDSASFGMALAVRFVAILMRLVGDAVFDSSSGLEKMGYTSLLIATDTIVTTVLIFWPKFLYANEVADKEFLPDLFVNTTVIVASIDGFTAWCSVREPIQVFRLLERLYEKFEPLAERFKMLKVESAGEYYVAAAGVPDERLDHAVAATDFACECLCTTEELFKSLEVEFGPDTGDLALRVGIHSGPVTGGVIAGKQRNFQLFGDTMSTARLLRETGASNRAHISQSTAHQLALHGKNGWIEKRPSKVRTEEKGELQTFWLSEGARFGARFEQPCSPMSMHGTSSVAFSSLRLAGQDPEKRWIEWNCEVLRKQIVRVVARRQSSAWGLSTSRSSFSTGSGCDKGNMPLAEVQEIIELPRFDKEGVKRMRETMETISLSDDLLDNLRDFVSQIAGMYRHNPFHNFAHASYVVMAVNKYMNRIMAASEIDIGIDDTHRRSSTHAAIHDHTYGIASDPLTQFACLFSALIHDVDHPGVPNLQLVQENKRLAEVYQNRSVAEQHSFDLAWDLFLDSQFEVLRRTICEDDHELRRFRQLVINSVMATDLGDKELKELRNGRWAKAFADGADTHTHTRLGINRKATIVIEHLIQAADIAHTCQHWNIYRKWNSRLFYECYMAFEQGRAEKNPADYWYEGELGFFDFYIIPLSKKLRDCGVFGPTSDENLNYAQSNREAWANEGRAIVTRMLEKATSGESSENWKKGSIYNDTTNESSTIPGSQDGTTRENGENMG
eukprot:Nitzschia sp. Nitz4//scaffold248_size28759//20159//24979//NITZ4_008111-RA/size28759-snap-gene-0.11-mRNA-1//-1//CDS//3329543998//1546//frame0